MLRYIQQAATSTSTQARYNNSGV